MTAESPRDKRNRAVPSTATTTPRSDKQQTIIDGIDCWMRDHANHRRCQELAADGRFVHRAGWLVVPGRPARLRRHDWCEDRKGRIHDPGRKDLPSIAEYWLEGCPPTDGLRPCLGCGTPTGVLLGICSFPCHVAFLEGLGLRLARRGHWLDSEDGHIVTRWSVSAGKAVPDDERDTMRGIVGHH